MNPDYIDITSEMIVRVKKFSEDVLQETYDRFGKDKLTRFERIFIGKMGELVFSIYLDSLGVNHDTTNMFAVFIGTTNVDPFDFVVPSTNETIDIKTAYKSFHRRILIPWGHSGQWDQMPKSYYVGVKIEQMLDNQGHIDLTGKNNPYAKIYGYVSRQDSLWKGPEDFGEGPCMWVYLDKMHPIGLLIQKMKK